MNNTLRIITDSHAYILRLPLARTNVSDLKSAIFRLTGIHPSRQILKRSNGTTLQGERPLSYMGVHDGDALRLILKESPFPTCPHLHQAAHSCCGPAVRILVEEEGGEPGIDSKSWYINGNTPLSLALASKDVTESLLGVGANPNGWIGSNRFRLVDQIIKATPDVVDLIFSAGADLSELDENTFLLVLEDECETKDLKISEILREMGIPDYQGEGLKIKMGVFG